jgi:hypothetical protein
MNLLVERFSDNGDSTLGILYEKIWGLKKYTKKLLAFTIEDEKRTEKVFGETRIPEGRYIIKLRTFGGFHKRYTKKYGDMHVGMLQIMNVPNFTDVLIHIGNDDDDTAGCLLVGDKSVQNVTKPGAVESSVAAYKRIYVSIAEAVWNKELVTIEYKDITEHTF